jgi:hypothetical protein
MHPNDDPPSVRYLQLSQQCMDLLHSISNPESRVAIVKMAQTWLRLAQENESSTPRLISQQQQQIQPKEPAGDDN